MRRSARLAFALVPAVLLVARVGFASDSAAALEQLKQGYDLKQAGKCPEAMPHFRESYRLDPQPKALLNLADCEARDGDLVSAQKHATEGRALARTQSNAELESVATDQLAALDKRMPRLTIRLAADAPVDTAVTGDGVAFRAVSLGVALPTNPGNHVIVATAAGHAEQRFEVMLSEGQQKQLEVAPGAGETAPTTPPSPPSPSVASDVVSREPSPPMGTQRVAALALGGAGVIALGVGSVFGIVAKNTYDNARSRCAQSGSSPPSGCPNDAITAGNDTAHQQANTSTIAFVAGGALLAGGAVLYFTMPKAGSVAVAPTVGTSTGGLSVTRAW